MGVDAFIEIFRNNKKQHNNNEDDGKWQEIKTDSWNPKEGETIEGRLISQKHGVGRYNQNMYILECNSKKTIIWGKTQLDKLMDDVDIDDYIRITFNGCIKTGSGHRMHVYNIQKRLD